MRLTVVGATGWLGGLFAAEVLERGHEVTAVVRDEARREALDPRCAVAVASVTDAEGLAHAIEGHDALLSGYRAPAEDPGEMPRAARAAIAAAQAAGVPRIVWSGGTGTLLIPGGGGAVLDHPSFPEAWRKSTLAHREALELFRSDAEGLAWTVMSPPRTIEPGERTGSYRVGVEEMLLDERGESRISAEDFAVAAIDLIERGQHAGAHVTVAY